MTPQECRTQTNQKQELQAARATVLDRKLVASQARAQAAERRAQQLERRLARVEGERQVAAACAGASRRRGTGLGPGLGSRR